MAGITFDELWEDLKNENEENRRFFQTAEETAKLINMFVEERVRQGLSQRDLAERCGLKQSAIARMESIKSVPRLDTIIKVADALNLKLTISSTCETKDVVVLDTRNLVTKKSGLGTTNNYSWHNRFRPMMVQ